MEPNIIAIKKVTTKPYMTKDGRNYDGDFITYHARSADAGEVVKQYHPYCKGDPKTCSDTMVKQGHLRYKTIPVKDIKFTGGRCFETAEKLFQYLVQEMGYSWTNRSMPEPMPDGQSAV